MAWIDPDYKEAECDVENSFVANSTGKGNYNEEENNYLWKGEITKCGSSEDYKIKNIYDLGGNAIEWTMEARNTDLRVNRGGYYTNTGIDNPASRRYGVNPNYSDSEYRRI